MESIEIIKWLAEYIIIPAVVWFVGFIIGRRKKDNDFLAELQNSIDLLSTKNKELLAETIKNNESIVQLTLEKGELMAEITAVRKENSLLNAMMEQISKENGELKKEMECWKTEAQNLAEQVASLTDKLDGVKTITRVKKNEQ